MGSSWPAADPVPNPGDGGDVPVTGSVPAGVGVGGAPGGAVVSPAGVVVPGGGVVEGVTAGVVAPGGMGVGRVLGGVGVGGVLGGVVVGGGSAGVVAGGGSAAVVVGGVLAGGLVSPDGLVAAADALPEAITADAADATAREFVGVAPSAVAKTTPSAGDAAEALEASIRARAKRTPTATAPSIRR